MIQKSEYVQNATMRDTIFMILTNNLQLILSLNRTSIFSSRYDIEWKFLPWIPHEMVTTGDVNGWVDSSQT